MLTIALLIAFVALAGLDAVRARVLTRASIRLDRLLAGRVVAADRRSCRGVGGARSQLLRDFDTFRQFITGAGIHAVFDLPWAPIYIGVIFAAASASRRSSRSAAPCCCVLMALVNEWLVRAPLTEANEAATRNYAFTEMSLRNCRGGAGDGHDRTACCSAGAATATACSSGRSAASDRAAAMQSLIKFLRLSMQSVILGLGAYLVIERLATVGAMFAASILLGRALQPVEQIVGSWRNLVSARGAYLRVTNLLAATPPRDRDARAAAAGRPPVGRGAHLRAARQQQADPARRQLQHRGRRGARRHRPFRRRQVDAGAPARRRAGADRRAPCGSMAPMCRPGRASSLGRYLGYLPQDIELFADRSPPISAASRPDATPR